MRLNKRTLFVFTLLGVSLATAWVLSLAIPRNVVWAIGLFAACILMVTIVLWFAKLRLALWLDRDVAATKPDAASMLHWETATKPVQRRLLLPLVTVLLLLVFGFGAALFSVQRGDFHQFQREALEDAIRDVRGGLAQGARLLEALENGLVEDQNLRDALKAQDRGRLLADNEAVYARFGEQYRITHFYFHGPDRVNLLRVHRPQDRGDLIDRFTAREAERTGKTASGIELGPLGTFTLRVVHPVFDADTLIGYVELGKEIEDILADLSDADDLELAMTIHKTILKRNTWESGMELLGRRGDWDRFAHDVVIYSSLGRIPPECDQLIHSDVGREIGYADRQVTFGDKIWQVMIDPQFDVSGTDVGNLVVFHDISEAQARFTRVLFWSSGGGVVLLTSLIGFLYSALRKVDQGILAREAALASSERFQRTLTNTLPDFIFVLDRDMIIQTSNRAHPVHGDKVIVGQSFLSLVSPGQQAQMREAFGQSLQTQSLRSVETSIRLADGEHTFLIRLSPLPGGNSKQAVVLIATDITERKKAEDALRNNSAILMGALESERHATSQLETAMIQLEVAATTDTLTGLPNRAVLMDRLEQAMKRAIRDGRRFAVLFFDFDRFKVVNDSLGHDAGDTLLCNIADIFLRELRDSDTVARFGGDEFVVLLDCLSEWADADTKAARLCDVFAEPHEIAGHRIVSTASIGLVTSEHGHERPADVIRDADAAMFQAKAAGRGIVVKFDSTLHEHAMNRLSLEADLHAAIAENQLSLVYQPVVALASGTVSGVEAFVCWNHPKRGQVSPAAFLPIAEETGLITEIGQWALRTACGQIADWNKRLDLAATLSINIRMSKRQLLRSSVVEDILKCLQESAVPAGELKLAITEAVIADDRNILIPLLTQLRKHGVHIVMDEFGTGVSSLSALHEYPIDMLKLDQSFIRSLDTDRSLLAVLASVTTLAENIGITTVAVGIESESTIASLQSIGCTWGQGLYYAKPMTPVDAEVYLRSGHNKRVA